MKKLAVVSDLKLDGRPFDPNAPTSKMQSIQRHLDSSPQDEVFTAQHLQEKGLAGVHLIRAFARLECFADYYYRPTSGTSIYFGHPQAIQLFRRKLAERAE